ncbi:TPA: hypothetical protein DCX15_00480 [bacterium]|nr:hypothetical protein [bacterium]
MGIDPTKISSKEIYSVKDIAQILRTTEQTVRNHLKRGLIKGVKNNAGRWHVRGIDLKKYLSFLVRA